MGKKRKQREDAPSTLAFQWWLASVSSKDRGATISPSFSESEQCYALVGEVLLYGLASRITKLLCCRWIVNENEMVIFWTFSKLGKEYSNLSPCCGIRIHPWSHHDIQFGFAVAFLQSLLSGFLLAQDRVTWKLTWSYWLVDMLGGHFLDQWLMEEGAATVGRSILG